MTPTPGLPLPAPRANLPKAHQRHLRAIIRQSLEELYLPTDPWLQVLADIGLQVAQDLPFVLDTLASIADDGGDSDSDSDSDGSEYDADADVESYRGRARRRPWSPPPTREQRIAAGPPLLPPRAGVRSRALGGGVSAADLKQRLHHVITVHTEPGTPGSSSYVPGSAEPLPARAGGRRPDPRLADIGGRVVLRGDPKQISKLADVAELIVFVACHQKLEFYLLRDMLVRIELPSGPRTGSGTSINSVASIASIGSAVSGMSAASAATAPAPRSRNSLFAWLWQSRIPQVPGIDADAAAASSSGDETDQVAPIRPYDPQLAALVSPHTSDLSRRQPRPRSIFGLASGGQPSPEAASPHVSPDNLFARAVNQIELAALSASPGVRFPPPLLLVRLRDQEALDSAAASAASLASLSSPMLPSLTELEPPANSQADPSLDASSGSPGSQAAILPAPHPASAAVSSTAQSPRSRKTLSTATALSRRSRIPADSKAGLAYLIKNNNSIGGVRRHQAISVAFSYFWDLKSTIPCRPPKVYTIRYYDKATESLQDRTLGQYIEMMCRDADAPCHDASCEHAMGEHQMEYHHGHGCVRVRMETADDGVLDDRSTQIYVWTQCAECGATSSMIPISLASWHVSFGKFLELLLYHSSLHPADMCEHISSSRQAVQHRFRCGRRTVVFEYAPMDLFEMRVPRIKVDPDYTFNAATSTSSSLSLGAPSAEQVQHLQSEIRSFYRSLTSYLTQLMTAVEPPGKSATPKAEAETIEPPTPKQSAPKIKPSRHASERLSEMLQDMVSMFPDEESHFIDAAQASSDLNQLRRMLCERIRERIESIETFHSDFVPDTACPHSWALPEYYDWHRGSLHLIPSSSVIVREDEPGSIIAFTLSSKHFTNFVVTMADESTDAAPPATASLSTSSLPSSAASPKVSPATPSGQSQSDMGWRQLAGDAKCRIRRVLHTGAPDPQGKHVHFEFSDSRASFACTVYFAVEFHRLREMCGIVQEFIWSLSRTVGWNATGGKSKASFFKTADDQFIIKELASKWTIDEKDALFQLSPGYFEYMRQSDKKPTLLAKILGFFTIRRKNLQTGQSSTLDVLVMEHLFANTTISRRFDLKGVPDRHVKTKPSENDVVMWDGDWHTGQYKSLLRLYAHSKQVLAESVFNDTEFLSNSNVMDYSLLVGVNDTRKELIVGIVDFIGPFNWSKFLETQSKTTIQSTIGSGKAVTVLPPDKYRDRFREAMEHNFLKVPDKWMEVPLPQGLPPVL